MLSIPLFKLVKKQLSYIIKNYVVVEFVIFPSSTIANYRMVGKLVLLLNFHSRGGYR